MLSVALDAVEHTTHLRRRLTVSLGPRQFSEDQPSQRCNGGIGGKNATTVDVLGLLKLLRGFAAAGGTGGLQRPCHHGPSDSATGTTPFASLALGTALGLALGTALPFRHAVEQYSWGLPPLHRA